MNSKKITVIILALFIFSITIYQALAVTINLNKETYSPGEGSTATMNATAPAEKNKPYNVTWYYPNNTKMEGCSFTGTTPLAQGQLFFDTCNIPSDSGNKTNAYVNITITSVGTPSAKDYFNISTLLTNFTLQITNVVLTTTDAKLDSTQAIQGLVSYQGNPVFGAECDLIVSDSSTLTPVDSVINFKSNGQGNLQTKWDLKQSLYKIRSYIVNIACYCTDSNSYSCQSIGNAAGGSGTTSFDITRKIDITALTSSMIDGTLDINMTIDTDEDEEPYLQFNVYNHEGLEREYLSTYATRLETISNNSQNVTLKIDLSEYADEEITVELASGPFKYAPESSENIFICGFTKRPCTEKTGNILPGKWVLEQIQEVGSFNVTLPVVIQNSTLSKTTIMRGELFNITLQYFAVEDISVVYPEILLEQKDTVGNTVNTFSLEPLSRGIDLVEGTHNITLEILMETTPRINIGFNDLTPPHYDHIPDGSYFLDLDIIVKDNQQEFLYESPGMDVAINVSGDANNTLLKSYQRRQTEAFESIVDQLIALVTATTNQNLSVTNQINGINVTFNTNTSITINNTIESIINITNALNITNQLNLTSTEQINYTNVLNQLVTATQNNRPINYTTLITAIKNSIVTIGDTVEDQSEAINVQITTAEIWEPNSTQTVFAKITDFKGTIIDSPDSIIIQIMDSKGNNLFTDEHMTLAGRGIYSKEYEIPANVKSGKYSIIVTVTEETEANSEVKIVTIGGFEAQKQEFIQAATKFFDKVGELFKKIVDRLFGPD